MKKKSIYIFIILLLTSSFYAQNVGINAIGSPPDASAMLDVASSSKGLLLPRITLTGTTDVTTIPTPATSLLVFNTVTVSDVVPGYYYWDGSKWVRLVENGTPSGGDWSLTGNAGTNVGTNFIGTTDAQDFALYTNNIERMRITTGGSVGIGVAFPGAPLDISGAVMLSKGGGNVNVASDLWFSLQGLIAAENNLYLNTNSSGGTAGSIFFATGTETALAAKLMTILSNGNVGIGTTAPTNTLDIAGDFRVRTLPAGAGADVALVADASGVVKQVSPQPVGEIIIFPMATPPTGYLICDGSAVSRVTYADLFSVLGVAYGAGNGTTTFNLPDLRGEFVRGLDNGRGVDVGRTIGSSQIATAFVGDGDGFNTPIPNLNNPIHQNVLGFEFDNVPQNTTPVTMNYSNPSGFNCTSTGVHTSGGANTCTDFARTRPRNVSMNYCIRY